MALGQYLLYKLGEEENAEIITLTTAQFEHLRLGWGDYRVKPLSQP